MFYTSELMDLCKPVAEFLERNIPDPNVSIMVSREGIVINWAQAKFSFAGKEPKK